MLLRSYRHRRRQAIEAPALFFFAHCFFGREREAVIVKNEHIINELMALGLKPSFPR
jgi:hypothetical protein